MVSGQIPPAAWARKLPSTVGLDVGESVGARVPCCPGTGEAVGVGVGTPVGASVGVGVGTFVGLVVGSGRVGAVVGALVGSGVMPQTVPTTKLLAPAAGSAVPGQQELLEMRQVPTKRVKLWQPGVPRQAAAQASTSLGGTGAAGGPTPGQMWFAAGRATKPPASVGAVVGG